MIGFSCCRVSRSSLWVVCASIQPERRAILLAACLYANLEWLTTVSVQLSSKRDGGTHWKAARERDPWLIKYYFSNNFFNPLGFTGIAGLFGSPAFIYAEHFYPQLTGSCYLLGWWLHAGRVISTAIELHFVGSYLTQLAGASAGGGGNGKKGE